MAAAAAVAVAVAVVELLLVACCPPPAAADVHSSGDVIAFEECLTLRLLGVPSAAWKL